MHIIFSEEELLWIDTRKFAWPIKDGCPDEVRVSILEKKKLLDSQMEEAKAELLGRRG